MDPTRELKQAIQSIEVDESEFEARRNRLSANLPENRQHSGAWLWGFAGAMTVTAVLFALFYHAPGQDAVLDLSELESYAANHDCEAVTQRAQALTADQRPEARANGDYLSLVCASSDEGLDIAVSALRFEQRTEFRLAFLDFLIEQSDQVKFSEDFIDELIDQENSPECVQLIRTLHKVS